MGSLANLPPAKSLVFAKSFLQSDQVARMATFEMMKKSLETLEKNVKVSKSLLGAKVDSLDEMKRNRQEAENDEDRRELKIAIESLETIIDKDRVAVADLEASYKELKEEVDKAEAEKVARETEGTNSLSVVS